MAAWTAAAVDAVKAVLSPEARVDTPDSPAFAESAARWSDKGTPKPGLVVHPSSEADVQAIVKHCAANKIPFVAQSGAHAWASWFRIDGAGLVIDMRAGFADVSVDADALTATVGGGATVQELMRAAKAKGCHVMTGTCNSVGAVPGMIGGGTGPFMGMMGCGADTMLSARVVTADGSLLTVSATENADLFWAVAGAGHNFGIVTTVTVRAIREINGGEHWSALVAFPEQMLERVVEALEATDMRQDMCADLIFTRAPPDMQHVVAVSMWHAGGQESARERFAAILGLGGHVVVEHMVPYDHLNDGLDYICYKGGFKPLWSVSLDHLTPARMRAVWDDFAAFSGADDAKLSVVNIQYYNTDATRAAEEGVANAVGPALRRHRLNGFACAIYSDPARHAEAEAWGDRFRRAVMGVTTSGDESGKPAVYVNFSNGDETETQLYGAGLDRLRRLKAHYDPEGVFSQFAPIVNS